jgi:selenophosphate synthetase-related protein
VGLTVYDKQNSFVDAIPIQNITSARKKNVIVSLKASRLPQFQSWLRDYLGSVVLAEEETSATMISKQFLNKNMPFELNCNGVLQH